MPSREAAALTASYRRQMAFLRTAALSTTRSTFGQVVNAMEPRTLDLFPRIVAVQLKPIAVQAATVSSGYLAGFAAANGAPLKKRPVMQAIAPQDRAERRVAGLMATAGDMPGDRDERDQHISTVRELAIRGGVAVVMGVGRGALAEGIRTAKEIIGYTRVTGDEPCAVCLALSGQQLPDDADMEAHDWCQCVAEPNTPDEPDEVTRESGQDRFEAMSTEQQDSLFSGRGGAEKADLIRSGAAALSDLVTVAHGADPTTSLTERSLESLTRLAR